MNCEIIFVDPYDGDKNKVPEQLFCMQYVNAWVHVIASIERIFKWRLFKPKVFNFFHLDSSRWKELVVLALQCALQASTTGRTELASDCSFFVAKVPISY